MYETHGKKQYGADKVALLGLFVAGLVIAYLVASSRGGHEPAKAGAEVVTEIKRKGISSFLDRQGRQSFFLIKDVAGHAVGFTMDVFTDSAPDANLNIQSTALLYIPDVPGRYGQEQLMLFRSDDSFNEFSWKSEIAGPRGKSTTRMHLGEDGLLTVTTLGLAQQQHSYEPGSALIPDFLLHLVFCQMSESSHERIIVDTISADGRMVEVAVSRARAGDSELYQDAAAYVLTVEFLGDRSFSEQVYIDSQCRISQILLNQYGIYIFERTSAEDVLRRFPEKADYILQENELSGQTGRDEI